MQHQRHGYQDDNLAEVWRSAQHRRTAELFSWLIDFFERRRRPKSFNFRYLQRRAAPSVWKLLQTTQMVSRTTDRIES